jgi:phosphoribosylamine---glycine ligase
MRVLVLGGGGREHALCWKIAQSPDCEQLYCAPGNAGTLELASTLSVDVGDSDAVRRACSEFGIDLVVVGPEAPLVAGLADDLRAAGIAVFGPSAGASQLEGSKAFANAFMARHGVPTAASHDFTDGAELRRHLETCPIPTVIKADGLAGGKGVVVATSREQALEAAAWMTDERRFGDAADLVVVEEFLPGEEASLFALVDGEDVVLFQPCQDHKRRFDGDEGPNTGGMGAYTPVPAMDAALLAQVKAEIIEPMARGLVAEGLVYRGLLYAGLMLTPDGPKVVEFNVRFGDPECQPLMMALDCDLLPLLAATARGELANQRPPTFFDGATLCVVVVADGYPGSYPKGMRIRGLEAAHLIDDVVVFHAGTRREDGHVVTSGGRVLGVTARGDTVAEAQARAYSALNEIDFDGAAFRRDIASRALRRE